MVGKAKSKSSTSRSSVSKSSKSSKSKSGATSSGSKPSQESIAYLELYGAVYEPRSGNYYHWAFVIKDPATRPPWHIFEVIQDEYDNYHPNYLQRDPTSTRRCHEPITYLGKMHPNWLETIVGRVQGIRVPGEVAQWNCQDYVMEIWDIVGECGMVEQETYEQGRLKMLPYYGQDFGGQGEVEEAYEEEEEEGKSLHVLSDEFVYDSDN